MSVIREKIKAVFRRFGLTVRRVENTKFFDFQALLYFLLHTDGTFKFVQIGGCDGVSFDPIHEFVLKNRAAINGLILEPLPDLCEMLQENYVKCKGVVTVNSAIHRSAKEMTIYRADPDKLHELPEHAKGISSFDPDHHLKSEIPSNCIVSETVNCVTIHDLLREHRYESLDLLLVDTEGYDSEILIDMDFEYCVPSVIRFEHGLQSGTMPREKFEEIVQKLHSVGYEVLIDESDAVAIQQSLTLHQQM